MDNSYPWRLLVRRLAWLWVFYFAFRVFFAVYNHDALGGDTWADMAWAFVSGLKFDGWAILWTSLPIVLITFLPIDWQSRKWVQRSQLVYMAAVQFFCFGLNIIDIELYKFTGRRLSMDWLHLQKDLENQSYSLVAYYWWLGLVGLAMWFVFLVFYPRWKTIEIRTTPLWKQIAVAGLAVVFLITGLRGGLQYKPLSLNHAYMRGSSALGVLTLNSTFSFFKNRRRMDTLSLKFFDSAETVKTQLSRLHIPRSARNSEFKGWNVVLIIVESLNTEYMGALNDGEGYTSFLDELSRKSILFANNFANGRRSIEAVPSLLCGLPSLMDQALIVSPYQGIELQCLGQYAKAGGYSTHFFHGAYNGSMHFDAFSRRAGFDNYYGYNEFGDPSKSDGIWGIFDEPFLDFSLTTVNTLPQPFISVIFTLSSHHPYRIPPEYRARLPKGELEIHPSIAYVDQALRKFFAAAESQPWFNKTIFMITGDHTHKSAKKDYQNLLGYYRVPLMIYIPGGQPARPARVTQHIDVLPTLIDLLGLPAEKQLMFGQSVFADNPGVAFNGDERGYWLYSQNNLVQYLHGTKEFQGSEEPRDWLKAVVHYFNEGVVANTLYRF